MAQVGEFPLNRRTIRQPVNPLDKSTVVSILPKKIVERKVTIQPGVFELAPGTLEKPSLLVVGTSSWWRELDENQPLLELPVSSIQIADSIVRDYCNGLLACDMDTKMPGLFWIPGEVTRKELQEKHMPLIIAADRKQKAWFLELILIADILWSRSNGNPLSISEDARLACKMLNIANKPWLGDLQQAELIRCVACGSLRNANYPICQTCKAVADPELAKKLNLTFAQ